MRIGTACRIGTSSKRFHSGMPFYTNILNEGIKSKIFIDNNCRINGAYIHVQKEIRIGDNCVIAAGVSIMDSNGNEINHLNRTQGRDIPQIINLGSNVWIGLNSIILKKNSTIGNNCFIAVGNVVKGNFPKNSLIMGNPAKIVKASASNRIFIDMNNTVI